MTFLLGPSLFSRTMLVCGKGRCFIANVKSWKSSSFFRLFQRFSRPGESHDFDLRLENSGNSANGYQKWWFGNVIFFQTELFWISILKFRGVRMDPKNKWFPLNSSYKRWSIVSDSCILSTMRPSKIFRMCSNHQCFFSNLRKWVLPLSISTLL